MSKIEEQSLGKKEGEIKLHNPDSNLDTILDDIENISEEEAQRLLNE